MLGRGLREKFLPRIFEGQALLPRERRKASHERIDGKWDMLRVMEEGKRAYKGQLECIHYLILWAAQDHSPTVNEQTWIPADFVDAKVIQQWNSWKNKKHLFEPSEPVLTVQISANLICKMIRSNVSKIFPKIVLGKW